MTIEDRLLGIFRDVLEDDELVLTEGSSAADIEEWDSLVHVTLMFNIEQEYGIQFSGEEFARLENVGDLQSLVHSKQGR